MTYSEKEKCAEVWEIISKEKTSPNEWCKEAGDALAEMVAAMRSCSTAMKYVPRPSGSRPGYLYIVNYVYNVLKQRYKTDKGRISQACLNMGLYKWRTRITIALKNCH